MRKSHNTGGISITETVTILDFWKYSASLIWAISIISQLLASAIGCGTGAGQVSFSFDEASNGASKSIARP
ncbi:MAG: hypothetical protein KA369_22220 [Spirochaetes bacterium]|nr:hypothetical protein [Spirochaetota bacterium]